MSLNWFCGDGGRTRDSVYMSFNNPPVDDITPREEQWSCHGVLDEPGSHFEVIIQHLSRLMITAVILSAVIAASERPRPGCGGNTGAQWRI